MSGPVKKAQPRLSGRKEQPRRTKPGWLRQASCRASAGSEFSPVKPSASATPSPRTAPKLFYFLRYTCTYFPPHRVCRLFAHLRAYSNHVDSISTSFGPANNHQKSLSPRSRGALKTALKIPPSSKNTKKHALDLVQSAINPFIINIFFAKIASKKRANLEVKFGPFSALESAFFGPFRGLTEPAKKPACRSRQSRRLLFPLDLCHGPA